MAGPSQGIAFLGAGNMAGAVVDGLLAHGLRQPSELACLGGQGTTAAALAKRTGIRLAASVEALLAEADVLIVAFKPQHLSPDPSLGSLSAGRLVISVLAGKTLATLQKVFPSARALVRCMPNTPGQIGAGITGWCGRTLSAPDRASVEAILGALGRAVEVPEAQMDAVTSVSGSGPAYVFEFAAALRDAGIAAGLDASVAQALATETLLGSARLLARREIDPEILRNQVTSPNGTTAAALRRLGERDFRGTIREAVLAAKARAAELSGSTMGPLDGRILVTGGAGFIGSALVWALNRRGLSNILICDLLDSALKRRNIEFLEYSDYVEGPVLRSRIAADPAFGEFSAVFHLGACSSTTERNAAYLLDNNTAFTAELARWALATGARFIYASSAATYGDGSQGMDDRDPDIDRLRPLNLYGHSKNLFDWHAKRAGWLDRIVGLKYFNVYGPNEEHKGEMRSLVSKAYDQIRSTGRLRLFKSHRPDYKDGEQMRDFLYVKDAVEMTLHFAERGSGTSGLFNLGSGEANTWLSLAGAIFSAMHLEPAIEFVEMPEILRGKYQYYTRADIAKLRASGYGKALTPMPEAAADYIRNYLLPDKRLGE